MPEEELPGGYFLHAAPHVFPLGQDSILLAAFAKPRPRGNALDLGCGAGVLSLILLARYPMLHITALDNHIDAYTICNKNIITNKLQNNMKAVYGDIKEIRALVPHGSMDFVICNPPYFPVGSGKIHDKFPTARGQQQCAIEDVAQAAAFALKGGGKCAICYRPERLCSLFAALEHAGLRPKRLRMVHQRPDKAPSIVMVEAMKGAKEGLCVLPPLFVQTANGEFTEDYQTIYEMPISNSKI